MDLNLMEECSLVIGSFGGKFFVLKDLEGSTGQKTKEEIAYRLSLLFGEPPYFSFAKNTLCKVIGLKMEDEIEHKEIDQFYRVDLAPADPTGEVEWAELSLLVRFVQLPRFSLGRSVWVGVAPRGKDPMFKAVSKYREAKKAYEATFPPLDDISADCIEYRMQGSAKKYSELLEATEQLAAEADRIERKW